MSTYAVLRIVVLLLVLVPLASAAVVPLFGAFARRLALTIALVQLGLVAAVVTIAIPTLDFRRADEAGTRGDDTIPKFRPEFVPGDAGGRKHSELPEYRTEWTLFRLTTTPSTPGPNVQLFLGIDGLNLWLVALTAVMLPPVILISWTAVTERPGAYYGWLLLLQAGLTGCFLAFDVILFYVFFELTLIPAFFLIGRWGVGSGRRDAARKFFLYTLAGSLLTLLGVIGVVVNNPTPVRPKTGERTNLVVVPADSSSPTAADVEHPRADWVLAGRGPVTFSLPDLMFNVQMWTDAPVVAQQCVRGAEKYLPECREQEKKAVKQQQDEEAKLQALQRAPKPDAKEVQTARARVRAAEELAQKAATATRDAERYLASAKQALADAEEVRANNIASQFWLFVALMAGFMVKVPIWPFHTWLPSAYGEAPTGVVVLLSAVMAKLGTFGILRLVLPLVPDAALRYGLPVVGVLAAFGIVYAALCAYASRDIKLVVAYSSVSHLGFLVLGLFAFNKEGLTGSVLHMVNHGLSTGALFAALGFLAERYRTTEQAKFGGLMGRFPAFAVLTFVLCLASVGLPGLNNFVSEMMMMAGLFDARNPGASHLGLATVAAIGIFLSAWYTFTVLRNVFFNPLKEPEPVVPQVHDVTRREFLAFGSLALLCLVLGLIPQPVIDTMKADVRVLSIIGDKARARAEGVPYVYVDDEPKPPAPLPPVPSNPTAPMPVGGKDGKGMGFPGGGGNKGGFPGGGGKGFPGGGGNKGKDKGGAKGPLPPIGEE